VDRVFTPDMARCASSNGRQRYSGATRPMPTMFRVRAAIVFAGTRSAAVLLAGIRTTFP
jgi:hypothetical protein